MSMSKLIPFQIFVALSIQATLLAGCGQTSILKTTTNVGASAKVQTTITGNVRIYVTLDSNTYFGIPDEWAPDVTGEQIKRFGLEGVKKRRSLRGNFKYLYGTTTLVADDGTQLKCDYLNYGSDWRLLCKTTNGEDIELIRTEQ